MLRNEHPEGSSQRRLTSKLEMKEQKEVGVFGVLVREVKEYSNPAIV